MRWLIDFREADRFSPDGALRNPVPPVHEAA